LPLEIPFLKIPAQKNNKKKIFFPDLEVCRFRKPGFKVPYKEAGAFETYILEGVGEKLPGRFKWPFVKNMVEFNLSFFEPAIFLRYSRNAGTFFSQG